MSTYTVEIFGLSNILGNRRDVRVELGARATLGDLVVALRNSMPPLVGRIIQPDQDTLLPLFWFNVNGRFHRDEYGLRIGPEDHILILSPAMGG
jgi:hypothetical protein